MKINLFLIPVLFLTQLLGAENWTSFRGPTGMGVTEQKIPASWNEDSITWKRIIPGEGQSSVVEAGNKIFLTASKNSGNKRSLLCFTKDKGKLLWQKSIRYKEEENSHRMNGWCTPTPATAGNRVVAFLVQLACIALIWKERKSGNYNWVISREVGEPPLLP